MDRLTRFGIARWTSEDRLGIHPKVPAVAKHQIGRLAEPVQAVHHRLVTDHLAGLVARAEGRDLDVRTLEAAATTRATPATERPESPVAARLDTLVAARKALPARVTISQTGRPREVMRREHKAIVDRMKIAAYNAEEWMLDRLIAPYPKPHDVRDLLHSFAELTGEIRSGEDGVTVTLDPRDTPIHRRALHGLVAD